MYRQSANDSVACWDAMCGVQIVEDKLMQEPIQKPLVFN